jgi:hypothetical protein
MVDAADHTGGSTRVEIQEKVDLELIFNHFSGQEVDKLDQIRDFKKFPGQQDLLFSYFHYCRGGLCLGT